MALIDCPECGNGFSQYAKTCPQCGFPNPLAAHPVSRGRALAKQGTRDIEPVSGWNPEPEEEGWQPPIRRPAYRPPQPAYRLPSQPQPLRQEPETFATYAVETAPHHDNSLSGFFHGKTNFWFALCTYYLGGTIALTVTAVVLGEPEFMKVGVGGWLFLGLFLLFWNAKNLVHDSGKWIARLIIIIILLSMIGVVPHGH
jgi:hypothetical protein